MAIAPPFTGVITALVTPFENGRLDEKSFRRLIGSQLKSGIEGFVVNGTTGESPTLEWSEVETLYKWARQETGDKVPLILGTGSNSTAKTVESTRKATDLGADAVLVVTPYYNKPPQRGLVAHFKAVADASGVPVILYNVPGRTVTAMELKTIAELAAHPRIVGIKEASGDVFFGQSILRSMTKHFIVTSGDDPTCLDLALIGGHGVISVISHLLGRRIVELMSRAREKDASVISEYAAFQNLMRLTYCEANPIPVKMALYQMGLIASPELRLPMTALVENHARAMRDELKHLELV